MTALSAKPTPGLNDRGVAEEVSLDASMEEILQSIRKIISDEQEFSLGAAPIACGRDCRGEPADQPASAFCRDPDQRSGGPVAATRAAPGRRQPVPATPPGDGDVDTGHEPVPAPSAARNAGAPPARPPADRFPRTDRSRQPGSDGGSFARPPSPPAAPARSGPPTTRPSAISEGPGTWSRRRRAPRSRPPSVRSPAR